MDLKTYNMAKPTLRIFDTQRDLSQVAARLLATLAAEAVAARGVFTVALSGGDTPQMLYRLLSQPPYVMEIPWQQTHLFWGDERLVPPDAPGSNFGPVAQTLLNQAPIPAANIHRVKGELEPAAAVADYKEQLQGYADEGQRWLRFDLVLLGMGSDGHTASLFPGPIPSAEVQEPVLAVTAEYEARPAHRLTLTPLVFNDARHVLFLVTGENKAQTLAAVLHGPYNPTQWPVQRIQPSQGNVWWLVDKAAARLLNNDQ
jgi:6-phosphogluconolactonase